MATKSMLVNYVGYPNEVFNLMPDNGLANLAACLIRAGHETVIWDCSTVSMIRKLFPYHEKDEARRLTDRILARLGERKEPEEADLRTFYALESRVDRYQDQRIRAIGKEIAEQARERRLDFVGFKLWTGAGFHGAVILAEEVRKACPHIKVLGGGPHIDWFMHRIFDVTDAFDVLAYGEGEDVIVELAEYVEGKRPLSAVSNAIYRENGRIITNPATRIEDLDSLPLPCYDEDVYPAMKGDEKIKVVMIDESRGCPNNCHFCIHPIKSGRRRRVVDAKAFVRRLETLGTRYGFRSFRFAGSNPPASLRNKIAGEIIKRGIKITFNAFGHLRHPEASNFGLLRKAGCGALAFGLESGSQRILDESMNKHVKVEEIRRSLRLCKKAGISTQVSVIMPAPHETDETKEETFRLICEAEPDGVVVSYPALLIGTTWEKDRERFGFEVDDMEALCRQAMSHRVNYLAPPALWRPLEGYRLNGKTFHELGRETAEFVQRLKKAGIATQLFDHVFLMADILGVSAAEFSKVTRRHMQNGDAEAMGKLASRINRGILGRQGDANTGRREDGLP